MAKTDLYQPFAIKPIPTSCGVTASRANILQPNLDCCHGYEHCTLRFLIQIEKIRKDRQHSPVLVWLSLCKPFQGMKVLNCNWIWKIKYLICIFFFRFSLRSSLKRLEPFHCCYLSFSCFYFSAVRADHLPQSVLQIRPWNQTTTYGSP